MRWIKNKHTLLIAYILMVIVPLMFIAFYLLAFAQNRYVADSTIVVKQVGEVNAQMNNGIGALLGVSNTSSEDAQFLKAYIQSRDLVEKLDKKLELRKHFQGAGSDPIFELHTNSSKEELIKYYNKRVVVNLDESTMLLKISTEGFNPEFALKLNQQILKESEQFINEVSQRVAKEQLIFTQKQLEEASGQLKASREALLAYQNQNQMFDPQAQAVAIAQIVNTLENNLAQLRTEERTLLSYLNPSAPQIVAIRSQIESVQEQIEDEKSKLTSSGRSDKLNRSAADFEGLKAQVEFSTDLYKLSLASLEKARLEAVRKLKNIVVLTSPQLPQEALYPRITYIIISAFLLLNILFGIIMLIRSVIREHQE